jgi:hypothetical protein
MTSCALELSCRGNEGTRVIACLDTSAGSSQFESRTSDGAADFKGCRIGGKEFRIEKFPNQAHRKRECRDGVIDRQCRMTEVALSSVMQEEILTEEFR